MNYNMNNNGQFFPNNNGINYNNNIPDYENNNVVITHPKNFGDIEKIIDNLRQNQATIVDFSKIGDKSVQRILDYLSGAIYALGGSQKRVSDNMFLFTPDGVGIQGI